MSMINDALRRASSGAANAAPPPLPALATAPTQAPPQLSGETALSSDESAPLPARSTSSLSILLLALFLFCLAAAAGVYLWQRSHRPQPPKENDKGQTLASAAPRQPEKPTVASNAKPEPAPAAAARPQLVTNVVIIPAPTRVDFPPLRLQGIYYRSDSPSVMINNRSLYVNDQVQGVTVAAIDRSSVTLVLSGHTNVLTLR